MEEAVAVDAIVKAASDYQIPEVANYERRYKEGYQDGIQTALTALGVQGDMLERLLNEIFAPVMMVHEGQTVFASDTEEVGRVIEVMDRFAVVRWSNEELGVYPARAFGQGTYDNMYVNVSTQVD